MPPRKRKAQQSETSADVKSRRTDIPPHEWRWAQVTKWLQEDELRRELLTPHITQSSYFDSGPMLSEALETNETIVPDNECLNAYALLEVQSIFQNQSNSPICLQWKWPEVQQWLHDKFHNKQNFDLQATKRTWREHGIVNGRMLQWIAENPSWISKTLGPSPQIVHKYMSKELQTLLQRPVASLPNALNTQNESLVGVSSSNDATNEPIKAAVLYARPLLCSQTEPIEELNLQEDELRVNNLCTSYIRDGHMSLTVDAANMHQLRQCILSSSLIFIHGHCSAEEGNFTMFLESEDGDGLVEKVNRERLRKLFAGNDLRHVLCVVVLMCNSEMVAQTFLDLGVNSVIFAVTSVADKIALRLPETLLGELIQCHKSKQGALCTADVESAFEQSICRLHQLRDNFCFAASSKSNHSARVLCTPHQPPVVWKQVQLKQVKSCLGRERDMHQLLRKLISAVERGNLRLATLFGIEGVGKTVFLQKLVCYMRRVPFWKNRFKDGIYYVDVQSCEHAADEAHNDTRSTKERLCRALLIALREQQPRPGTIKHLDATECSDFLGANVVIEGVRGLHSIVVFDNCHVVAEGAAFVNELIGNQLAVIWSARQPLALQGATIKMELGNLSEQEATNLALSLVQGMTHLAPQLQRVVSHQRNPQAIKLLLQCWGSSPKPNETSSLNVYSQLSLDDLRQHHWTQLSDTSKWLYLILGLFPTGLEVQVLQKLTPRGYNSPTPAWESAVAELKQADIVCLRYNLYCRPNAIATDKVIVFTHPQFVEHARVHLDQDDGIVDKRQLVRETVNFFVSGCRVASELWFVRDYLKFVEEKQENFRFLTSFVQRAPNALEESHIEPFVELTINFAASLRRVEQVEDAKLVLAATQEFVIAHGVNKLKPKLYKAIADVSLQQHLIEQTKQNVLNSIAWALKQQDIVNRIISLAFVVDWCAQSDEEFFLPPEPEAATPKIEPERDKPEQAIMEAAKQLLQERAHIIADNVLQLAQSTGDTNLIAEAWLRLAQMDSTLLRRESYSNQSTDEIVERLKLAARGFDENHNSFGTALVQEQFYLISNWCNNFDAALRYAEAAAKQWQICGRLGFLGYVLHQKGWILFKRAQELQYNGEPFADLLQDAAQATVSAITCNQKCGQKYWLAISTILLGRIKNFELGCSYTQMNLDTLETQISDLFEHAQQLFEIPEHNAHMCCALLMLVKELAIIAQRKNDYEKLDYFRAITTDKLVPLVREDKCRGPMALPNALSFEKEILDLCRHG